MRTSDWVGLRLRTGVEAWATASGDVSVRYGHILRPVPSLRLEGPSDVDALHSALGRLGLLGGVECSSCDDTHEQWADLGSASNSVSSHKRSMLGRARSIAVNAPDLVSPLGSHLSDFLGRTVTVVDGPTEVQNGDILFLDVDAARPISIQEDAVVVAFRAGEDAVVCSAPVAFRTAPCVDCVVDGLRAMVRPLHADESEGHEGQDAALIAAVVAVTLHQFELGSVANASVVRLDRATGELDQRAMHAQAECVRCRPHARGHSIQPALEYEERIAAPIGLDVEGIVSVPRQAESDALASPHRPRIDAVAGGEGDETVLPTRSRTRAFDAVLANVRDLFRESVGTFRRVPSAGGLKATRCYLATVVDGMCHSFEFEGARETLAMVRTPFAVDSPDGVAVIMIADIDALVPKYGGNAPRLAAIELGMCAALVESSVGGALAWTPFGALPEWERRMAALPPHRLLSGIFVPSWSEVPNEHE